MPDNTLGYKYALVILKVFFYKEANNYRVETLVCGFKSIILNTILTSQNSCHPAEV